MINYKDLKAHQILLSLACLLLIWHLASLIISKPILPTPFSVIQNIVFGVQNDLLIHILTSLYRILLGLTLSATLGTVLGIAMGYYKDIDVIFSSVLYFNYPVPKMALLPICMLVFGLGDVSKILMIFMITFFPITINVRDYVKKMSSDTFHILVSAGASHLQILSKIVLPGIIPSVLSALRIGIGTSISVLFFTENFGTQYGMGYFIMDSWMRINYLDMYSGIMVLSIIGVLLFILIDYFEGKIRWLA